MDLDDAYANAAHIPGGALYPDRWVAQAAAFRRALGPRLTPGLVYGSGRRNWADLIRPEGVARGLLVFVHGGYWLRFSPRDFTHLAQGALAAGWAVGMPAYTLAPGARIAEITLEVGQAIAMLSRLVPGPIHLAGHSAGGHLVARMACAAAPLPPGVAARLGRIVPISGLGDLAPLMRTSMNAQLRIDAAEVAAESPALLVPRPGADVHLWVGADERPAFLEQSRDLAQAWGVPLTEEAGRHHFDVIDGLAGPAPLLDTVLGRAGP